MEYELKPITADAPMTDERCRLIDQRKWAIQLLADAFQQDSKGLVAAAKLVVAYVETSE